MKICILSMQRVSNFGSLLQSYALKRMLEQQGHVVSFLDIEPNQEDNDLLDGRKNHFLTEGEASGNLVAKLKKIDKYMINRVRIKYLSRRQEESFEAFRKNVLGMRAAENDGQFDCCVIGSDEVFNCMAGAPWGFTTQLFGNVPQAKRVITYAASCGATVYPEVPNAARNRIRDAFRNISAFSVRDKNTYNFTAALTDSKVCEHLDPAFIADFSKEINGAKIPENLPLRYCVVYSYYNRICDPQDIRQIIQFCKKYNMVPIAVGAPQMWIKTYLVLDPFAMLKVFQDAAFVITDTFHGTIFSAKYARRFAVMVRTSNSNKLCDLVYRLGLENNLISTMDQLDKVYKNNYETQGMSGIVEAERSRSMAYFEENLVEGKL